MGGTSKPVARRSIDSILFRPGSGGPAFGPSVRFACPQRPLDAPPCLGVVPYCVSAHSAGPRLTAAVQVFLDAEAFSRACPEA